MDYKEKTETKVDKKWISWLEKKDKQNEQSFWEKCNRCKYFDGYDICLHKKNFGTVTDGKKENCKNNDFFIEKQGEHKPAEWKPSEEQMEALKYVIDYFGELTEHFAEYYEIKSLYNDLKSL